MLTRALGVQGSAEAEQARIRPLAKRAAKAALIRLRELEASEDLPDDLVDRLRDRQRALVPALSDAPSDDDRREQLAEVTQRARLAGRTYAEMLSAARQAIVAARSEPGTDPKTADDMLRRLDLQSARFEL
jgi:CPA1 family monovalent cation:H+ antiporter